MKDNLLIGTKRFEKLELQDIHCYNGLTGRLRKNEKNLGLGYYQAVRPVEFLL